MRRRSAKTAVSAAQPIGRYNVEAISRAARLLQQFTRNAPMHGAADLSVATGISPDLVNRSLATLQTHGLIRSLADQSYTLGFTWLRYADVRRRQFNMRFIALPVMRRMRDTVNETVILAIRTGERRVNIDYVESTQAVRRLTQPGFEVPLHVGASGRALLSGLRPEELDAYFAAVGLWDSQDGREPSATHIAQDVKDVKSRGYAIAFREITSDTAAVAAPVKDHLGQVVASLTISCPEERFDEALKKRCIECVVTGAAEVSHALGFTAADGS